MAMVLFTFASTHLAMEAELLVEGTFAARLIPLPPQISAGCGLSLRCEEKDAAAIGALLEKHAPYDGVYLRQGEDYVPWEARP